MKAEIKAELEKKYEKEIPIFTNRLKDEDISLHPCFNCLRETEIAVNKGYWKKFPKPIYYWYEMCDAEGKEIAKYLEELKPKKILEIGCGSGRIINLFLDVDYPKQIYAVDKDKLMIDTVKPFFKDNKDVHIINQDVKDFVKKNGNFDLVICMMNTFGNIDSLELMKLIAEHSKHLIFTVYDKEHFKLRKEIYIDRGHQDFSAKDDTYYFNDCWVKGLKSKSYSKEELNKMCEFIGKKYEIRKISTLLFLVHIYGDKK